MSPIPEHDLDLDSRTSEMASQDSPLRRQFSEPIQANSTSTQASPSPSPITHEPKCVWCGEFFESSGDDDSISSNEALKKHIASVHPHIAKFSMYDGAADEDEESHIHDDNEHSENEDNLSVKENGAIEGVDDDNINEGVEATEIFDDNEKDAADIDGDEPEAEGEGEVPEGESELALSNQLHEFSREQDSISLEKRLHNLWNIHDIRSFSVDYDSTTASISQNWSSVFHEFNRGKKRDASEILERPEPYKKTKVGRGEFLEITPLEDFLSQLRDSEMRPRDELYAITENVAYALKAWQDEYLAIDKLHKLANRHHAKATADPRKFQRPQVFEDKKEAMLYGYKHDPKEDKVGNQNPFVQGGFKPTPTQFRKMTAKAGPNNENPDGWPTIMRFGVEHVPKFQNPPREEFVGKATRKRKAAEMEAANKANEADEAPVTPAPAEPDQDYDNSAKRRTRTRRQATEADQVETGARSSTRGRGGRARGRGGARSGSRAVSEVPLAPSPTTTSAAPARSTPIGQGRDVLTMDGSSQARTGTSQLVPIEPAPSGSSLTLSSTRPQTGGAHGESADAAELARRQKIANSKNPKRTEAMLNHWARFNREGRVRNPKRSKAQIEADRAAEAARKATEPPKIAGKKKKSTSPTLIALSRADPGLAPAPPAMAAPAPLGAGHHAQLAPIAAARGPLAPYPPPPMDPRAVAPFPTGPRGPGPLQQLPPQPYHTPYPDYYIPYGAAAAGGLPPPGHTRPA